MEYPILDRVNSPDDLKLLNVSELPELCSQIRGYMVEECSRNPGHLGSSLGTVELIVGLHYVFDAPKDKIVFDVGHQAYAHKIITGRREQFKTQRTEGGISGFPKPDESIYDSFGVGHSSTSISAALGMAEAGRLRGEKNHTIALIGDGALSGGLAFEGLNNAGDSKANIIVVLNDNDHSIDDSRGALRKHLMRITTSRHYNIFKDKIWDALGDISLRRSLQRAIRSLKSHFVKKSGGDIFVSLGMRYFGPVDGNDIQDVVRTLRKIKDLRGPILIHAITRKGKGYAPAEMNPTVWHAPGKFNPLTGERIISKYKADRYQDVFGEVLTELALQDKTVVGITPAMASGCGMDRLAAAVPERFYDVGIEEEHAVTFAAGLAASGMRPFCNIYSTFSQRAYDQIIHDVAMQRLPVVLCFDRAGLVGEDGTTHQGAFDLAAYRSIPNTTVCSPADEFELKCLMHSALHSQTGPYIIRYPRGLGEGVEWKNREPEIFETGKAVAVVQGSEVAIIAIGPCVNRAKEAAQRFEGKIGVFNFRFLKPLDEEALENITSTYRHIITVEDGCVKGGLFGAVSEYITSHGKNIGVTPLGIPDTFIAHASQSRQRELCRLDKEGIEAVIAEVLQKSVRNYLEVKK